MKFLRFRYILPFSLFVVSGLSMIAYAMVTLTDDDSSVWYWPTNPLHTNKNVTATTDAVISGLYCSPGNGWSGGPWGLDLDDPIITPPPLPTDPVGWSD